MTVRLHVNIDHVATLRNARDAGYPDPITAASICELAGADGITAHLREDRRHIRDEDIRRLRVSVRTMLNLEMGATDEMLAIALDVRPDVVTLVPERREERTTEGGLDVVGQRSHLDRIIGALRVAKIRVSLFLAPDLVQIHAAAALLVDQIELHTGEYCHQTGKGREDELKRLETAARATHAAKIAVAAGHGLTRHNVGPIAALHELEELNIGHAIIADAVMLGLPAAVTSMREAIARGADAGDKARRR
jgi:pyridoxine 5-phosphate synthase